MTSAVRDATLGQGAATITAHPYRLLGAFRFYLASLVLVSHTAGFLSPTIGNLALGDIGVMLFFVVSGFVICEACDVFYRGRVGNFLLNRGLKIYPAYWAAIAVAYIVFVAVGDRGVDLPIVRFDPWALLVNVSLLLSYLPSGNNLVVIPQTWAIVVEFQFYFIAAVLFWLTPRLPRPNAALAIAAVLSLAFYVYVWATGSQPRFFGAFIHAPFFVFGGASYFMLKHPSRALRGLVLVSMLLSFHAYLAYGVRTAFAGRPWSWPDGVPQHVIVASAIFAFGVALFLALGQVRTSRPVEQIDKRLGDLTYPIYVTHHTYALMMLAIGLDGFPAFALVVLLSLGSAVAIRQFVERPAIGLRNALRGVRLYE